MPSMPGACGPGLAANAARSWPLCCKRLVVMLLTSSPAPLCFLQVNSYQPYTGKAACVLCPAGTSTEDTGNTACQPCSSGFYSPTTCEHSWQVIASVPFVLPAPTPLRCWPCSLLMSLRTFCPLFCSDDVCARTQGHLCCRHGRQDVHPLVSDTACHLSSSSTF